MTAMDLLDLMNEAGDGYLQETQHARSGAASKSPRPRLLLFAVLAAVTLLLVGCTVAYVQGWFTDFFAKRSGKPLSQDQVQFIQDHELPVTQSSTQNGWTVELRSLMTDGTTGYIILGVTAPEGVSLKAETFEMAPLGTGQSRTIYLENSRNRDFPPPVQYPEGVRRAGSVHYWTEDGDGLDNTKNYVIRLTTDPASSYVDPFGPEAVYTITIQNFAENRLDPEALRAYLPQSNYLRYGYFTPDELEGLQHTKTLAEGLWEFEICFDSIPAVQESLELISDPVVTRGLILECDPKNREEHAYFQEEVGLTSFVITPLSATFSYYVGSERSFTYCDQSITAVMKDGSKIEFSDGGASGMDSFGIHSEVLAPETPIVLEKLHYILLSDGTRLYANGRVKSPKAPISLPVSVPEELVPGRTTLKQLCACLDQDGVYGCLADFDGDGNEDLALWQDWAFRAVCLLDSRGVLKQEYRFDSGFSVRETWHLRREDGFYEGNLLTFQSGEACRIYQLREEGLHFLDGWKTEDGKYFQAAGEDRWTEISEDDYALLRGDYRDMDHHLMPIGVCWQ